MWCDVYAMKKSKLAVLNFDRLFLATRKLRMNENSQVLRVDGLMHYSREWRRTQSAGGLDKESLRTPAL